MRVYKNGSLWVFVSYSLILLGIALWVRDVPNQPDAFEITLQQIIETSKMGDPGSFAKVAIDIAQNGWISSANAWIFNLWPPGFMLLEASIIKILGPETPVILVLQILAVLLFAVVLTLFFDFLNTYVNNAISFTLPLAIFAFPVSRVYLLQPTGISLGESFAVGSFLLCLLLILRAVNKRSLRFAVYAGLFLALSAYFRSQFEIILLAMTGWGILLVIAVHLTRFGGSIDPNFLKLQVKTIVVVLFVAHAATIPWRAYHWIYQGKPFWVSTSSLVFKNSVMSSEALENNHGGFVVAGGGNLVCRINPSNCGDTANAKKLFVRTFLAHPVEWYSLKFDVIGKYWFSSVKNWVNISVKPTSMDIIINALILIALIALVPLLFAPQVRSHGLWIMLMWFNISLFSTYVLIFTVAHYEARYFYFPKVAAIFMFFMVICLYYQPMRKIDVMSEQDAI